MHFDGWIDQEIIGLETLESLIQDLNILFNQTKNVCIHCKAGLGRSGVLISSYILKKKIDKGKVNATNLDDKIFEIVIELRKDRGIGLLQHSNQLDLVREYGKKLLNIV